MSHFGAMIVQNRNNSKAELDNVDELKKYCPLSHIDNLITKLVKLPRQEEFNMIATKYGKTIHNWTDLTDPLDETNVTHTAQCLNYELKYIGITERNQKHGIISQTTDINKKKYP